MTTEFTTAHIKGHGRGKFLGYPTVNLAIPQGFELADGIYAVRVTAGGNTFQGAMHWGSIPTFDQSEKSLEVFLLDVNDQLLSHTDLSTVTVQVVEKIRDVEKFSSLQALTRKIDTDVAAVRRILKE